MINECPRYNTKLSVMVNRVLGNIEYLFIAITARSTLTRVVVPDRVPSMSQIELFDHLTMCKQMTNVKLNCWYYIAILGTIKLYANE